MSIKPPQVIDPLVEALIAEVESVELVAEDGENLDSAWHRSCINLLIAAILHWNRARTDFYVGGNMFVYFNLQQARNRDFRGPAFFYVRGGNLHPQRPYWATWLEGGRFPEVIIELLSPTTEREDRTTKRTVYEQTFRAPNYYCYDPFTRQLEGWELHGGHYQPLQPNDQGRLWSSVLGLWVGTWDGEYERENATWLRFFDENGQIVLTEAEAQRQRADDAEAELTRLRALLAQQPRANGPEPPAS